jgi:hypothetical protein
LEDVYKDAVLVMSRATEASEILWKNMKGDRGLFIFRRTMLFLVGLVVIIFGTTPAVIAANIDYFHVLEMNELNSSIVSHYLSPLFVILINQLLLVMIDWSSILECHETHNMYQRAVYIKSVVYLGLNMMVAPALSLNH